MSVLQEYELKKFIIYVSNLVKELLMSIIIEFPPFDIKPG